MSKKVVAFSVPHTEKEIVRVQVDDQPYFYDQLHQHPEIQIMFIESGEGTLVAGDYVGRFQSGEVYVLGSGQPHVFRSDPGYYTSPKLRSTSISLYFNEDYFGKELWGSNEMVGVREFAKHSRRGLRFQTGVETIVASIRVIEKERHLARLIRFFSLLDLLIKSPSKQPLALQPGGMQESEEVRMNEIMGFTFRESHRKIYLHEAAKIANLSVEAFCRYFKLHTRKTYIRFLNEVRISRACQLLFQRDLSVEEVCFQSGFSNVSNFNRIFRRIAGKNPLSFRKQLPFAK